MLFGCAAPGYTTSSMNSTTTRIYDTTGITQVRIRDGDVYNTQGIRTHRIDSQGNIYSVTGPRAGQRVGKIGK
jgi:hypothetical protein